MVSHLKKSLNGSDLLLTTVLKRQVENRNRVKLIINTFLSSPREPGLWGGELCELFLTHKSLTIEFVGLNHQTTLVYLKDQQNTNRLINMSIRML